MQTFLKPFLIIKKPLVTIIKDILPLLNNDISFNLNQRYSTNTISYLKRANFQMNISKYPNFKAIFTPELELLSKIFAKNRYQICLSGGPVRDIIMGKVPEDLDFATNALPSAMKNIFTAEKIRILNKNGEKHGTITVRINDKVNYEITTLRIDKITDGRHAQVEFTEDWCLDAHRRDLTINSMFLDFEGNLYDFCGGYDDLQKHRIAFVGDAEKRIKEDYLRILRYFRFYGKIVSSSDLHEPQTLDIIAKNASGLSGISGERLWSELKKICLGNHNASLLHKIYETGVATYLGLPQILTTQRSLELNNVCKNVDITEKIVNIEDESYQIFSAEENGISNSSKDLTTHHSLHSNLVINPITILTALLNDISDLKILNQRIKLSNHELQIASYIIQQREHFAINNKDMQLSSCKYFIDHMVDAKCRNTCRYCIIQFLRYSGKVDLLLQFLETPIPHFPIRGTDLASFDIPKGPRYALILQELKNDWKRSNFQLTKSDLLHILETKLHHTQSTHHTSTNLSA